MGAFEPQDSNPFQSPPRRAVPPPRRDVRNDVRSQDSASPPWSWQPQSPPPMPSPGVVPPPQTPPHPSHQRPALGTVPQWVLDSGQPTGSRIDRSPPPPASVPAWEQQPSWDRPAFDPRIDTRVPADRFPQEPPPAPMAEPYDDEPPWPEDEPFYDPLAAEPQWGPVPHIADTPVPPPSPVSLPWGHLVGEGDPWAPEEQPQGVPLLAPPEEPERVDIEPPAVLSEPEPPAPLPTPEPPAAPVEPEPLPEPVPAPEVIPPPEPPPIPAPVSDPPSIPAPVPAPIPAPEPVPIPPPVPTETAAPTVVVDTEPRPAPPPPEVAEDEVSAPEPTVIDHSGGPESIKLPPTPPKETSVPAPQEPVVVPPAQQAMVYPEDSHGGGPAPVPIVVGSSAINAVIIHEGNGFAIASAILGIIAAVFAFFPVWWFAGLMIAAPCALFSFVFGIMGIVQAKKVHQGMVFAIIGLLACLLATLKLLSPMVPFLEFLTRI